MKSFSLGKNRKNFRLVFVLAIGSTFALSPFALSDDQTWKATSSSTTTNWDDGANWVSGNAPTNGESLIFSSGGSAMQTSVNNISNLSIKDLTLDGTRTMTFTGNAITLTGDVTNKTDNRYLVANVSISLSSGVHTVTDNSTTGYITLSGSSAQITGAGSILKKGTGLLIINGVNNSFTGGLTIDAGTVRATQSDTNFGTGVLTINASGILQTYAKTVEVRNLYGTGIMENAHSTTTAGIVVKTTLTDNYFSGLIRDGGDRKFTLTKSDSGTLALSGVANTYTGATTVDGGILQISTIKNGETASSIGRATSAAANLVLDNGTLKYVGSGDSTNRNFTIGKSGGSNTATLDASGTGALHLTSTDSISLINNNTAHTLTLTGTNTDANMLDMRLTNAGTGASSLTKSGTGKWVLTATNTYTGGTTVSAGTLIVDGTITGATTVSSGATLGGHGTVGTLSGAGTISAGNSPGILTATSLDPSSGMDFYFEFTQVGTPTYDNAAASGNDVLRLTDATPFSFDLDAGNVITVDFSGATLAEGQVYQGGFYADSGDFLTKIANATFNYVGVGGYDIVVNTLQQNANFTGGSASGYVTQFTINAIPEPGAIALTAFSLFALITFGSLKRRFQ